MDEIGICLLSPALRSRIDFIWKNLTFQQVLMRRESYVASVISMMLFAA